MAKGVRREWVRGKGKVIIRLKRRSKGNSKRESITLTLTLILKE